uniref:MSP domain-containing protein n=1 Tax=Elaeophora elaphi TaxID=1147741 RepID=A0A0R3S591_9BILA
MGAAKRQITIGQYFFPRTTYFSDNAWNTNAHLLTDPFYDEIIFLPQPQQQQLQLQQQRQQQPQQQPQPQQQQRGQPHERQNMGKQGEAQLYPIPSRIFYKNRFKSFRDIRPTQRSLFYDKKTGQYTVQNDINGTHIIIPHDEAITDVHIRMSVNSTDDIHATVVNKPISMLTQDKQYRYGGYVGRVTIDLSDTDSSKITNAESIQTPKKLQNNNKFSNFFIHDENEFHSDRSHERFFRSNTEIFNQILKVRKDIDGLRREIRKVKNFVQRLNFNFSKYNTNANEQLDRTTSTDNSKDANFRSRQFGNNISSKRNMFDVPKKPVYIAFPRTTNNINSVLMSRLQANAAAPLLKNEHLRRDGNEAIGKVINSTKFSVKIPFELDHEIVTNVERIIESNCNGHVLSSVKNGKSKNENLLRANESNSTLMSINEGCNKTGKILQKSETEEEGERKNGSLLIKEAKFKSQFQQTNAKFQLLVTVRSPNNEKVLPNIAVTEAYQPFSIKRYIARSKINFDREINQLFNFNTSKPLPLKTRPMLLTTTSARTLPMVTQAPADLLSTTTKSLSFEFDTMPPLIALKPNFFGSNFDGIFVPWFNDPQLTLWPEGLFRRG